MHNKSFKPDLTYVYYSGFRKCHTRTSLKSSESLVVPTSVSIISWIACPSTKDFRLNSIFTNSEPPPSSERCRKHLSCGWCYALLLLANKRNRPTPATAEIGSISFRTHTQLGKITKYSRLDSRPPKNSRKGMRLDSGAVFWLLPAAINTPDFQ